MGVRPSLWYQDGPSGRQLTKTAREIYDRTIQYLESEAVAPDVSLEQRFKQNALEVMVAGAPLNLEVLRQFVAKYAHQLRPMLRGETPPLESWIAGRDDREILAMIRDTATWLRVPAVAARFATRVAEHNGEFIHELARKSPGRHRPRRRPSTEIQTLMRTRETAAAEVQQAWVTLRGNHQNKTLLEIGARLHDGLEGRGPKRLFQSGVKEYLAGLCVIVRSKDGDRFVTIEDQGWPRACALTLVSRQLGRTKSAVLKAIRKLPR